MNKEIVYITERERLCRCMFISEREREKGKREKRMEKSSRAYYTQAYIQGVCERERKKSMKKDYLLIIESVLACLRACMLACGDGSIVFLALEKRFPEFQAEVYTQNTRHISGNSNRLTEI